MQHVGEHLAILRALDALRRGTDDVNAVGLQAKREVERRLPAELGDGAPAFFTMINVQDILERKRLEKQLVARVVVGGDGLGVRVDHDGFEPFFLQSKGSMHTAVVKLDALANPVRAAAEDHHLLFLVGRDLVVSTVVGGVIVWRVSLELRRAGVDQPVAGLETKRLALGAHLVLSAVREVGDLSVGESE